MICICVINDASAKFSCGTNARVIPDLYAAISAGNAPRTARIFPSRASSPNTKTPFNGSCGIACWAIKIASAIDKSKLEPLLGSQAGESETVTLRFGQLSLVFIKAARTRSRDSLRAASGRPNSEYIGMPSAISTSTVTTAPSSPSSATLWVIPSVIADRHDIQWCVFHLR